MSGPDPYKPAKPRKINEVPEALHGPREGAYSMNKGESDLSGQVCETCGKPIRLVDRVYWTHVEGLNYAHEYAHVCRPKDELKPARDYAAEVAEMLDGWPVSSFGHGREGEEEEEAEEHDELTIFRGVATKEIAALIAELEKGTP